MEALVLKTYPTGDANLVLRLLTPSTGKISVFARGARRSHRRFANPPDIFDLGHFEVRAGRGSLPLVTSFRSICFFHHLRNDLNKMVIASSLCEIADHLLPEECSDQSQKIFSLTVQYLKDLDQEKNLKAALRGYHALLAELLNLTGFSAQAAVSRPSLKHLRRLLDHIENTTERKLQTRPALEDLLQGLKKPLDKAPP